MIPRKSEFGELYVLENSWHENVSTAAPKEIYFLFSYICSTLMYCIEFYTFYTRKFDDFVKCRKLSTQSLRLSVCSVLAVCCCTYGSRGPGGAGQARRPHARWAPTVRGPQSSYPCGWSVSKNFSGVGCFTTPWSQMTHCFYSSRSLALD